MESWREELVYQHVWLVDRTVVEVRRLVPGSLLDEDLRASGFLGLVQAASRFRRDGDVPFHAFALIRVRGAMLDSARAWDNAPKRMVEMSRRIDAAERDLCSPGDPYPTDEAVANLIGEDVETVRRVRSWRNYRRRLSLDGVSRTETGRNSAMVDFSGVDDLERVELQDLVEQMRSVLASLPQAHRDVVEMTFLRSVASKECAAQLGVSPARVSQIRHEALAMIRERMHDFGGGETSVPQSESGC